MGSEMCIRDRYDIIGFPGVKKNTGFVCLLRNVLRTENERFCAAKSIVNLRPFIMQDFLRFKNGPFSSKAKKHNHMRLKMEQFHHRLF